MFTFLLVVHALIAASLVGVILMQRSEGGGFAGGGNPTGLISARGAGDFLTRATAILATAFILLSIGLAALAAVDRGPRELDKTLDRTVPTAPNSIPTMPGVPMGGAAAPAPTGAPAAVPLQGAPATEPTPAAAAPKAVEKAATKPAPKPEVKREAPAAAPKAAEKVALPPIVPATPATAPAPATTPQP